MYSCTPTIIISKSDFIFQIWIKSLIIDRYNQLFSDVPTTKQLNRNLIKAAK